MSVDIDQQLRALGQHLEHDAPPVGVDDVLSRVRAFETVVTWQGADASLESAAVAVRDRSAVRRRSTLMAAAVVAAIGLVGLVVIANRSAVDEADPPRSGPVDHTNELAVREPAVFPIVGERAGPKDRGSFSLVGSDNPARIMALVARRDGDTLHDALLVMAVGAGLEDGTPPVTAPAEAVGEQVFEIHGRTAEVWTEPFEIPVQHVRFDGEPILEVAGVDALAFMQAAGADAIRIVETTSNPRFALEVGDLPNGYDLIVDPFIEPLGAVTASISVGSTQTTEGSYVGVELTNPLAYTAAYSDTVAAVDINGHQGWISSKSGNWLTWEPVPGTFATAGGTDSPDESIALARSIQFVDRATWQTFYAVDDPKF